MRDKQIIIDGIDVSGCWCIENGYCLWVKKYYELGLTPKCEQVKDCYYKQLKRKEQECEELTNTITNLENIRDEFSAKIDQLKAEVKSKTEYIQEQRDIINQYSKEIEMYKKCQGKRASKREEELKADNEKYKQILIDIKEIAEPYQKEIKKICCNCNNYDDCHACCKFDLNCYQYKKGDTTACEKFIVSWEYDKHELANKILQKISECEGNDE